MAKPICVIYYDMCNEEISSNRDRLINEVSRDLDDYHVFFIPSSNVDEAFVFHVFHEKNFTEIQYKELKKIIEDAIVPKKVDVCEGAESESEL